MDPRGHQGRQADGSGDCDQAVSLPILRYSFANPFWWGWHRFRYFCQTLRGTRY